MKYLKLTLLLLVVFLSHLYQVSTMLNATTKPECKNSIAFLLEINRGFDQNCILTLVKEDTICNNNIYRGGPIETNDYIRLSNILTYNSFDSTVSSRFLEYSIIEDSIVVVDLRINLLVEKERLCIMLKDSLSADLYEFMKEYLNYKQF